LISLGVFRDQRNVLLEMGLGAGHPQDRAVTTDDDQQAQAVGLFLTDTLLPNLTA
jgi:hypothetical protein